MYTVAVLLSQQNALQIDAREEQIWGAMEDLRQDDWQGAAGRPQKRGACLAVSLHHVQLHALSLCFGVKLVVSCGPAGRSDDVTALFQGA